jgi:hypothetical protein
MSSTTLAEATQRGGRLERSPTAVVAILIFIAFCLYYFSYIYFFTFEEGVSAAPNWLKGVKDVAYLALFVTLAVTVRPASSDRNQFIFVPFGACLLLVSLIHAPHTSLVSQLWENIKNIAIYIPVYMAVFHFSPGARDRLQNGLFALLAVSAVVQVAFAQLFRMSGGKLWLGDLFGGFIGNPNSFGLTLNLAAAVCLSLLIITKRPWVVAAAVAVLAIILRGILGTNSGSQLVIFLFLIPYAFVLGRRNWLRLVVILVVVAGVMLALRGEVVQTFYSVQNVDRMLGDPSAGEAAVSGSVLLRGSNIKVALSVLLQGVIPAMFGDFRTTSFVPMDGQFWVLLFNGGLLTLGAFALAAAYVYARTLLTAGTARGDWRDLALHLMIVAFGVTLIASRVLQYFPLNFLFFLVCGLAMARLGARTARRGISEGERGRRETPA